MAAKRRFKFPIFYVTVLVFVIAGFIVLHYAADFLTVYLTDYEDSLPKYDAEAVFADYYNPLRIDELLDKSGFEVSPFEKKSDLTGYFETLTAGKEITYNRTSSSVGGKTMKFNVKAGGKKFSDFTLVLSEKKSEFDFDLYELGEIHMYYRAAESVKITLPSGGKVLVNNTQLGEKYVTEDNIPFGNPDELPPGVTPITFKTYTVGGLLNKPEVEAYDRFGDRSELSYDDGAYRAEVVYDDGLAEEYSDYVIKAIQTYSDMTHRDATKAAALKYYEKGSNVYEYILKLENSFDWDHNGSDFEDARAREFYAYSEDVFSCRVSFVHKLYKTGREPYIDPLDLTVFLRRNDDGKYLIFAQHTNI
ncbi:hypothetical protein FACS1894208_03130 [Clostridia bacterium]|nr:hypothetical protein FACS1894208_03130 [Clostridia bacterium]